MGQQQPNGKTKRPLLVALLVLVILGLVGAGGYAAYAHFVLGVDLIAFLRGTPDDDAQTDVPPVPPPVPPSVPPSVPTSVPTSVPKVVSFVREDNPHPQKLWGCQIPGTDARSSSGDRASVQALCTERDACTGYYDGGPWYIATDADPAQCTVRGKEAYPHFYRKKVS